MKVSETKDWKLPSYTQQERVDFAEVLKKLNSGPAFTEEVWYMSDKTYKWLMDSIRKMENATDEDT